MLHGQLLKSKFPHFKELSSQCPYGPIAELVSIGEIFCLAKTFKSNEIIKPEQNKLKHLLMKSSSFMQQNVLLKSQASILKQLHGNIDVYPIIIAVGLEPCVFMWSQNSLVTFYVSLMYSEGYITV